MLFVPSLVLNGRIEMSIICPLFSGSTGNSTYIGARSGGILIDAGASAKGIGQQLSYANVDFKDIKAVQNLKKSEHWQ